MLQQKSSAITKCVLHTSQIWVWSAEKGKSEKFMVLKFNEFFNGKTYILGKKFAYGDKYAVEWWEALIGGRLGSNVGVKVMKIHVYNMEMGLLICFGGYIDNRRNQRLELSQIFYLESLTVKYWPGWDEMGFRCWWRRCVNIEGVEFAHSTSEFSGKVACAPMFPLPMLQYSPFEMHYVMIFRTVLQSLVGDISRFVHGKHVT